MISKEQIQELIDKVNIVEVVSEYTQLTRKGNNYFGLCPFHNDNSPSFSVSPDKKIAKCMSCGEGGNVITFLQKVKKISFMESCNELATRVGMKLDLPTVKVNPNQKLIDINKTASDFYQYNLENSKQGLEAKKYLNERGLTDEVIKEMGIGLAPNEKDTLIQIFKDKNILEVDLVETGLVKNNNNNYYDFFVNRIVFPIKDVHGNVLAFSGRTFNNEDSAKYINTMETPLYVKGNHLYNLNNAKHFIKEKKQLVLCEGQMDVISLLNAGINESVCALGSALTKEQVDLLKKHTDNIVLCYDNDNAGVKATLAAIEKLNDFNIEVVELPVALDPDDYIKQHGVEEFNNLFKNKISSIEYLYKHHLKDVNTNSIREVEETKDKVFNLLKDVSSTSTQEKIFKKLANDLDISIASIEKDFSKLTGQQVVQISNKTILSGRITRDPELKIIGDKKVLNYSIAVNKSYKNAQGEYDVDFFNCVAWNHNAEYIHKNVKKGNVIDIEGSLQTKSYIDKNGNNISSVEILTNSVNLINSQKKVATLDKLSNNNIQEESNTKQTDSDIKKPITQNDVISLLKEYANQHGGLINLDNATFDNKTTINLTNTNLKSLYLDNSKVNCVSIEDSNISVLSLVNSNIPLVDISNTNTKQFYKNQEQEQTNENEMER